MKPDDTAALQQEIADLKQRIGDTRELYREVCALLFFRHGVTPTANRLYQLVRRGSMGTPAEVLRGFWQDLRDRSRVRLSHPGIPSEFVDLGGELLAELWKRASDRAEGELESLRAEARAAADAAAEAAERSRRDADAMRAELESLRQRVPALEQSLATAMVRDRESTRELATTQGRFASMSEMLRESGQAMQEMRAELAAAQRDTARAIGEANALRVQLGLLHSRGRRPPPGVPGSGPAEQEDLGLDPSA
jgi:Arc/MetJ-type ribon-helix-helix transcriptional regulator